MSNRIRGLPTQVRPVLERVLGPRVSQKATLALLIKFGGPTGMRLVAVVTHRSGITIRGEHPDRSGNKHLRRAFCLSAVAALRADPISGAY